MPKKLYEVLDVSEDASRADIQRAYRRKVKESHPDVSDDPDAAETFQLVLTAKEVLTDPDERELYDDLGHKTYMDMFGDLDGEREAESRSTGGDAGPVDEDGGGTEPAADADSSRDRASGATEGGESTSSTSSSSRRDRKRATSDAATSESAESSSNSRTEGRTSRSGASSSSSTGGSSTPSGGSAGRSSDTDSTGQTADDSGGRSGNRSTRGATGAVSEAAVADEAERTREKWQTAARGGDASDANGPWTTSTSQGDHLAAERVDTGVATKIRSQDAIEMTVVMLVAYPVFVFSSVWLQFPTTVRLFIAAVTMAVVLYTLTEPVVGLVVFGTWSVLTPLLVLFLPLEVLSLWGLYALTVTWVPFALSVLLTLAMPD